MSNSESAKSVPDFIIPERWTTEIKRRATLAHDLIDLQTAYDGTIDDLIFSTNPGNHRVAALWVEAAIHMMAVSDKVIEPLSDQIRHDLHLFDRDQLLDGKPAARFVIDTRVTLGIIMTTLNACTEAFGAKLQKWKDLYPV